MTSEALQTYLRQLDRELAVRGIWSSRVIEEAREHLVDAIEDGLRRGLSLDVAERRAVERFGAPDTIAAHVEAERHGMTKWKDRLAGILGAVWRRRWWILVPAVMSAAVTSVVSYYFLPTRYQSEASIIVVPQRVSPGYVRSSVTVSSAIACSRSTIRS
jgi:Chain length determinant protein/HAAS